MILINKKLLFFHHRKLEDIVFRKKQHKELKWTGRLLFITFKKAYTFFLI